jgi:hypothetical protein
MNWTFGSLLLWSLYFMAIIILIWVIIAIISDLFRDHETNGFVKALWVIFLVVAPWLGSLIYLIARHKGMAERSMAAAKKAQEQQAEYIKSIAGSSGGPTDQIAQDKQLLDSGAISQAEFDQIKAKALA